MNETKFTTNDGAMSSGKPENFANPQSQGEFSIPLEHGKLIFDDRIALQDHTQMRSQQLSTLLRMTYGMHSESFYALGSESCNVFHWHVHQMAMELDACIMATQINDRIMELSSAGEGM